MDVKERAIIFSFSEQTEKNLDFTADKKNNNLWWTADFEME